MDCILCSAPEATDRTAFGQPCCADQEACDERALALSLMWKEQAERDWISHQ